MRVYHIHHDGCLTVPAAVLQKAGFSPGDQVVIDTDSAGNLVVSRVATAETTDSLSVVIGRKNLATEIRSIKGVSPKLSELLAKRNIVTVEDALFCLPNRYEDRREVVPVKLLKPGTARIFQGTVLSAGFSVTRTGKKVFEALVGDDSGTIVVKWFQLNPAWLQRSWKVGKRGLFSGDISMFGNQKEVHHPDVEWMPENTGVHDCMVADPANFGNIVPVYPLTVGLQQKGMRRVMRMLVEKFVDNVPGILTASVLSPLGYMPLDDALRQVHLPSHETSLAELNEGRTLAHRAIAFDEFFFWELGLALKKRGVALEEGIAFQVTHRYTKELAKILPFQLTAAQRRVLSEIKTDMMAPHPMHRLVQGDVGSGKTMVALMSALIAVENGYQVAIMAPTEILAEQHWHNIHHLCEKLGVSVVLLTAGMKGRLKKDVLEQVAEGRASIVIGTHSVIQDKVVFHRLGLGIVDEQHRFGVLQRSVLKKKGTNPDILVMTATPIPRTLAMTLFGDLSISVINELPPGRTPIETKIYHESRRRHVYDMIRHEITQKRQVYVIYPLVEESEKTDLKAAAQMAEHLQNEVFPDLRIGLLHGKMRPDEKEEVMASFKGQNIDILVATTVIEVGIDVPNATLMVIEHAERFGLSQLHQLRGRVGRGAHRSCCILMISGALSEDAEKRIKVMERTNDGFRIAEADLEIRGPGDFLGIRQSGMPDFRVASILRDRTIQEQARYAAHQLLLKDENLVTEEGKMIMDELLHRWGNRLELAGVA